MSFASAAEASRTVPVLIIQAGWDFWTIFWVFVVPAGLLLWLGAWLFRRYKRDLRAPGRAEEAQRPAPKRGDS